MTGGSGSYANNLGRPAAGKTGTSQNAYSAWFAGYTPNLSTAVSIFREDGNGNPVEIGPYGGRGEITGGSFPTMVWTDYMIGAVDAMDLPVEQFPERGELPQVEKPANDSGVPDQAPAPAPQPEPRTRAATAAVATETPPRRTPATTLVKRSPKSLKRSPDEEARSEGRGRRRR